jgi:hypothetical protein
MFGYFSALRFRKKGEGMHWDMPSPRRQGRMKSRKNHPLALKSALHTLRFPSPSWSPANRRDFTQGQLFLIRCALLKPTASAPYAYTWLWFFFYTPLSTTYKWIGLDNVISRNQNIFEFFLSDNLTIHANHNHCRTDIVPPQQLEQRHTFPFRNAVGF